MIGSFFESHDNKALAAGVTVGIVTQIDDPEKLGRIKVKLINRTTSDDETDWIRIVTPMAGENCGMFFLPNVGDEVLVAFGDGDLRKPYVLGCLRNKERKPSVELDGDKNDVREIKTVSGNCITFNDKKGEESVTLMSSSGTTLELNDKDNKVLVQDKDAKNVIEIDIKNGKVLIKAQKDISFEAGKAKLVLNGSEGSITMEGKKSVAIKASQISVEGQSDVTVKGNNKVSVESTGTTDIKGTMAINLN